MAFGSRKVECNGSFFTLLYMVHGKDASMSRTIWLSLLAVVASLPLCLSRALYNYSLAWEGGEG